MADKETEKTPQEGKVPQTKYFAYVQRPGEKQFLQTVFAFQRRESNVEGVRIPERCASCEPDSTGVFTISASDEFYDKKLAAMEKAKRELNVKDQPLRLVGPFNKYEEAMIASVVNRPLTAAEENAELKARIKELESKKESK